MPSTSGHARANLRTMPEPTPQILNHFALVGFTADYWREPAAERQRLHRAWLGQLCAAATTVHLYQTFATEAASDLLIWSAADGSEPEAVTSFLGRFAEATAPYRSLVTVREVLWGFTRPSQYTKTRSTQEMDPFAARRQPYLIMYPFIKTADWYLKDKDERQRMMAEHIKIGKQYKDITQLLLYSFGLQDQEFVVVYETHDLVRFMDLVYDLRATEARIFTERDYPLHTGLHQPNVESLARWL